MQSLPRRLRLGIELPKAGPTGPGEGAFSPNGMTVARVTPGGMADSAGMTPDDVLSAVNDQPVRSRAELQIALRSAARGGTVKLRFDRAGESIEKSVEPVHADLEEGVHYDAIERDGKRLRTMVGRPAGNERRAALLFVQGLSTTSVELAFPELFRGWRDAGLVTMRLERRGVGDSEGEAPEQGDFVTEVADVRAALLALAHHDFVDPEAVFVFGHSVGGMIAPKLEADDLVRAYLTYGSSAEPWFDCLEDSAHRQWVLRDEAYGDERLAAFREEMRTQEVLDGRSALYHRQLHEAEIAAAWSQVRRPVRVLHGEYDWVVSEEEERRIAELTGGTFRSIAQLDHLFTAHDSIEESLRNYGRGRFESEIVSATSAWILGCAQKPA